MARTPVPLSVFEPNSALADPAGTPGDAVNGHSVAVVFGSAIRRPTLEELVLRVVNGGGAPIDVTVLEGPNPPCTLAIYGDLVVGIPAGETRLIGPFTSARFKQVGDKTDPSGLWFDLDDDTSITVTAFHLPRRP